MVYVSWIIKRRTDVEGSASSEAGAKEVYPHSHLWGLICCSVQDLSITNLRRFQPRKAWKTHGDKDDWCAFSFAQKSGAIQESNLR